MKPAYDLVSFHIIEKFNNNNLITWTYPNISDVLKQKLVQYCMQQQMKMNFIYLRLDNQWVYIWERIKEHKTYALALVTKGFNPHEYQHFVSHMCNIYETNYKPIELVHIFLGAFTSGSYKVSQNGIQHSFHFNENRGILNESFDVLVNAFDVEIILIFNALLLKKRIVVYHFDIGCLLKHIEVMVRLTDTKLRSPNDYLFPCMGNVTTELKGKTFFLAGITDKTINIKPDAYDLFINLENSSIKISPSSNDIFLMTKWHKEIAALLTEAEVPDKTKDLYRKTSDLLENLRSFAVTSAADDHPPMITLDTLRSKKFPPAMENFLLNLAVAENIMML